MRGIYGLVDPRDGRVRYVGQSEDVEKRYRQHLDHNDPNVRKRLWIKELSADGRAPGLSLLEAVPVGDLIAIERRWIDTYRDRGEADLNIANGGSRATIEGWVALGRALSDVDSAILVAVRAATEVGGAKGCDLVLDFRQKKVMKLCVELQKIANSQKHDVDLLDICRNSKWRR